MVITMPLCSAPSSHDNPHLSLDNFVVWAVPLFFLTWKFASAPPHTRVSGVNPIPKALVSKWFLENIEASYNPQHKNKSKFCKSYLCFLFLPPYILLSLFQRISHSCPQTPSLLYLYATCSASLSFQDLFSPLLNPLSYVKQFNPAKISPICILTPSLREIGIFRR